MLQAQAITERLRASLWFVPALFAVGAIVLAQVILAIDARLGRDASSFFLYGGTPEGARSVLSAIAQSMLTFTGLVFTITMLVLQLASSQLSPRVMRTFLRDRANQAVLGVFVATFVFTLLVLRDVRSPVDEDPGFVPGIGVWSAFVLLLASVGAFVYYIDHMAHAIRASNVIASIAAETSGAIDRLYPDRLGDAGSGGGSGERDPAPEAEGRADHGDAQVVAARGAGILAGVDEGALIELASEGDRRVEILTRVGDFVPEGGHVAVLHGFWDDEDAADKVHGAINLADERTLQQDAAFGIRLLVDVALRALSPGTNDPTTAVQALDRLHDLLRRLAPLELATGTLRDEAGTVRLVRPTRGWEDFVELTLEEIRIAGEGQPQVTRRLRTMLEDLLGAAPDARRAVLRRQLARLPPPP